MDQKSAGDLQDGERESPQSLLVGTKNGLYHYQGEEKRWADITYDLEDPDIKGMVVIEKRCLLATKSGLFLTEDLGKNYTKVLNEPDLCVGTGQGIAVSPGNPHIVYVSYVSSHKRGIFRSSDGGRRWMNVSGKLPQDPRALDSRGEFHVHGWQSAPRIPTRSLSEPLQACFKPETPGKTGKRSESIRPMLHALRSTHRTPRLSMQGQKVIIRI